MKYLSIDVHLCVDTFICRFIDLQIHLYIYWETHLFVETFVTKGETVQVYLFTIDVHLCVDAFIDRFIDVQIHLFVDTFNIYSRQYMYIRMNICCEYIYDSTCIHLLRVHIHVPATDATVASIAPTRNRCSFTSVYSFLLANEHDHLYIHIPVEHVYIQSTCK